MIKSSRMNTLAGGLINALTRLRIAPSLMTLVILTTFAPATTHAVISVSGLDRASVTETTTSGGITIYGGIAGDLGRCDTTNNTQVCNNCRLTESEAASLPGGDAYLKACNERRIYPGLLLAITFSSDALDGVPTATSADGAIMLPSIQRPSGSVAKGTQVTVLIPWSSICDRLDAAGCTLTGGTKSGSIRVGISSDGNDLLNASTDDVKDISVVIRGAAQSASGDLADKCDSAGTEPQICYFDMGPGDEKAIVKTILAPTDSGFPIVDGSQFKYVRFLFEEQGFNYIHLGSQHVDLPIAANDTSTFNVSPRRIEGLQNDKQYYFKSALVDAAGNVSLYSQSANDTDCSSSPNPSSNTCRTVTPSEVVGVLDKTNCFIATAAYGSQFAGELDTLRDFRDQVLMRTNIGHSFVRWYYDNSPYYAKMILKSPVARAVVRTALVPVVWFAGMALAYGPMKAALAFLFSLILVAAFVTVGRRPEVRAAAQDHFVEMKKRTRRSLLPALIAMLFATSGLAVSDSHAATSWGSAPAKKQTAKQISKQATKSAAKPSSATALSAKSLPRANASTATASRAKKRSPAQEILEQASDDETPPEPEYPYPGAQGTAPVTTTEDPLSATADEILPSEPLADEQADDVVAEEPAVTPAPPASVAGKTKWPTSPRQPARAWQKPKTINEEGAYIYEATPDEGARNYGEATAPKFSNQPGREKPMTITNEGEYRYPVAESDFSGAAGVRFGFMGPPDLKNSSNGLTFQQIYGKEDVPGLLFEYEYPFTRALGRIGLKFETGVYAKQAQGRFKDPSKSAEVPEEKFTFVMIPLQAMLHYRFQFADAQWVVPFIEGGGAYNGIVELRDDNKKPRFGGAPGLLAGGGVNILLDWIDRRSVRQLDAEYGINHVWFTAQYRQYVGLKKDLDLTSHLISGGFTFDF